MPDQTVYRSSAPKPRRPDFPRSAPAGFHWEADPAPGWRLRAGKPCTFGHALARRYRRTCSRPAVAELNRGNAAVAWFAYCEDHLDGNNDPRWIESGQVMHWRIVKDGA